MIHAGLCRFQFFIFCIELIVAGHHFIAGHLYDSQLAAHIIAGRLGLLQIQLCHPYAVVGIGQLLFLMTQQVFIGSQQVVLFFHFQSQCPGLFQQPVPLLFQFGFLKLQLMHPEQGDADVLRKNGHDAQGNGGNADAGNDRNQDRRVLRPHAK